MVPALQNLTRHCNHTFHNQFPRRYRPNRSNYYYLPPVHDGAFQYAYPIHEESVEDRPTQYRLIDQRDDESDRDCDLNDRDQSGRD